jgi:two-component system OmpR family response regulator
LIDMHLLYVTDRQIDAYLLKALREAGHVVEPTDQPADGVVMAATGDYQAVMLDWSAPPVDCAARFAAASGEALVLVIAAAGDDADRAKALKAGADACFIRPVPFIELEARIDALARLVRRTRPASDFAPVEMLVAERAVRVNGRTIALSGREFHLMAHLVAHTGEVTSVERLQQHVWGDASEPRPDLVRTCVSRLRRKLEAAGAGRFLRAVSGHGYSFEPRLDDAEDRLASA